MWLVKNVIQYVAMFYRWYAQPLMLLALMILVLVFLVLVFLVLVLFVPMG